MARMLTAIKITLCFSVLLPLGLAPANASALSFNQIDTGLQTLVIKLRRATAARDANTIYAALAWNYKIERDYGGSYLEYERPAVNFSFTYQFDNDKMLPEYKDYGWKAFEIDISGTSFEKNDSGETCMPAGAGETKPLPIGQLCFAKSFFGDWQISKHINGGD